MENQENCSTPVMTTETAGCAAVLKKKLSDETSKKIAAIRIPAPSATAQTPKIQQPPP